MKWLRNRFLLLPYVVLLIAFVTIGCTSKRDPAETLDISGNHSTGDLVMVTTDTSSEGYHYLDPQLSPDESKVLFTAPWAAIPTEKDPGDAAFTQYRQMLTIPLQEGVEPKLDIEEQGGVLLEIAPIQIPRPSGRPPFWLTGMINLSKGDPIWFDDTHVIFWVNTGIVGQRMFRADISEPSYCPVEVLFMEPSDDEASIIGWQHMGGALSADKRWLAFTRSGCTIPDSFETCSGVELHVLDMATAGLNDGFDAVTFPLTRQDTDSTSAYSRIEQPSWHPDGTKIIFSGGMDVGDSGVGSGTELFTIDFDTTGLAAGTMVLDNNIKRLTYTRLSEGDPITGVLNYAPVYSNDRKTIYFVSTRRAPTTTLHNRNVWAIPADGRLEPEIYYFTREDDSDPSVMPNGRLLFTSTLGFPTEMLVRLEEESYQDWVVLNNTPVEEGGLGGALDEVQMRKNAADEILNLEFFLGVMSHLYTFSK